MFPMPFLREPLRFSAFALCGLFSVVPALAVAQDKEIPLAEGWILTAATGGGRSPIRTNAVEAKLIEAEYGRKSTQRGEEFLKGIGIEKIEAAKVDAKEFKGFSGRGFQGSIYYSEFDSPTEQYVKVSATGANMFYVNGEPHGGDVYSTGAFFYPVKLRKGLNRFFFYTARGSLRPAISVPDREDPNHIIARGADVTFPDWIQGETKPIFGAIPIANLGEKDVDAVFITATTGSGKAVTKGGAIEAGTIQKVPFLMRPGTKSTRLTVTYEFKGKAKKTEVFEIAIKSPRDTHKRTFLSKIDWSVQYYGVQPSTSPAPDQALFLSLHGASVEGIGQAGAYGPKTWGHIIAPTNRRPYGFDWEEVGRLDAVEVLDHASQLFQTDPRRTYLTGHSMGGHGTWQIGAQFSDRFAAIAPCAGWISFDTYGGGGRFPTDTELGKVFNRAKSPSDTLGLKGNYNRLAIFALHGDADETVPVSEPRRMREELKGHPAFYWFEQPGGGHWYDTDPEPGSDCVDYAGIFNLFARTQRPLPQETKEIDFTTASPGVSAKHAWVTIQQQVEPFSFSNVKGKVRPLDRTFELTTKNVQALDISLVALAQAKQDREKVTVNIDGQSVVVMRPSTPETPIHLTRNGDKWVASETPVPAAEKNALRSGGFKDIFKNRTVLVYGTGGDAAMKDWAKGKARFDHEQFFYRGNGLFVVVPDTAFEPSRFKDSNVLLYGRHDTNSAWAKLIDGMPISVQEGSATVRGTKYEGTDLAVFAITKRRDSDIGSVAVIAPTGSRGAMFSDRVAIFTPGAAFPDFMVIGSASLTKGIEGVTTAGFWDNRWK